MTHSHGTQYGYAVAGCRCAACRQWNAARARAKYRRRRAREAAAKHTDSPER